MWPDSQTPEGIGKDITRTLEQLQTPYLDAVNFSLSQADMDEIDVRAKEGKRDRVTPETGIGFTDEYDFSYEQCWPIR